MVFKFCIYVIVINIVMIRNQNIKHKYGVDSLVKKDVREIHPKSIDHIYDYEIKQVKIMIGLKKKTEIIEIIMN